MTDGPGSSFDVPVQEVPLVQEANQVEQGTTDTVLGSTATTAAVSVGGTVNGVVNFSGDQDWYRIVITAGESVRITLNGLATGGATALADPLVRILNSGGTQLASNDDSGGTLNSRIDYVFSTAGTYYISAQAYGTYTGGYQLAVTAVAPPPPPPPPGVDQIVNQIVNGYWQSTGGAPARWASTTITYNVTALTAEGQALARAAFALWSEVSNLTFTETTSTAGMVLDDNQSGAFASSSTTNGFITSANINVATSWLTSNGTGFDSYSFQTYVHEIGHALGFGHGGNYNGSATWGIDNSSTFDNWSNTVMSYFDQSESGAGSYRLVMGPQIADIIAAQQYYGVDTTTRSGDTVYGHNATTTAVQGFNFYSFQSYTSAPAFCIYDSGGIDTLDCSGYGQNQRISLIAETFSSVGGLNNNISIARGVVVENGTGGSGNDTITGNTSNNTLRGNGGTDSLIGGGGNDTLNGGTGNDTLDGGADNDVLVGEVGADTLNGGDGYDTADYSLVTSAVVAELWRADAVTGILFATDGAGSTDQLIRIEAVYGGTAGDLISGDSAGNFLLGFTGLDTINGGFGDDYIDGGADNDYLFGGVGGDTILCGTGNDTVFGGDVGFSGADGADSISGDAGNDFLIGEGGNDTLDGGADADYLVGGYFGIGPSGNDSLLGRAGADTLLGEDGNDTLDGGIDGDFIVGGTGNDQILGDDGADFIVGDGFGTETGNDTVNGGGGNDTILGGLGNDSLSGGTGSDFFWITLPTGQSSGVDSITDYDLVNDVIVIDAVNPAAVTFAALQGLMTQTGANVTINLAAFGHAGASLVIQNVSVAQLQANDFIVF